MDGAEHIEQIWEGVQHAPRIEVAEPEHSAIRAAGIVWKDSLQSRMSLSRRPPLLAGVARDTHHPHLAVGPGLLRDPLDRVVVVGIFVTVVAFRLGRAARLGD